ncbi:MAG: hypothetical protein ABJE95_28720 [Byssovorax sp.]
MATRPGNLLAIETTAGEQAYALASEHRAELDPRLPPGTIDTLRADLTTLGVSLITQPAEPLAHPPSLSEALAVAANLVTAIHDTVLGAKPKPATRKAYGAASKPIAAEVKRILAAAEKIVEQATGNPSEALALGILPTDITALRAAASDLTAAEAAARGDGEAGATKKEQRAAATRMLEATARIAGAGALAFAQNGPVRAQFEALKPKKKSVSYARP